MLGMDKYLPHPARDAARRSMNAVEAGDRAAWLSLFTPDAVVADPVGPSPFDPAGLGHHGPDAIAGFYDNVIAKGRISFAIRESFAAGNECANVGTITTRFDDGSAVEVDLVSVYTADSDGRLASLRAYWEIDNLRYR
ncbi:nuclear transport factor 2 family protein [Acidiferrimicrobium sp. IK]|nr:nuclear transport factor 2 family protein [Acidiferrimicrobium sp. IK]